MRYSRSICACRSPRQRAPYGGFAQSLYVVLRGESKVTADMALRFGALAGAAPELYLHMQDNHDLWHA